MSIDLHDMTAPPERSSRWIPYSFFAMFGVILAVNGVMLYMALSTFNGLSTDGAYDRGLAYNEALAAEAAQAALGWEVGLDFVQAGPLAGRLAVTAVGPGGHVIDHAAVTVLVRRPTNEGRDFTLSLPASPGEGYAATLDFPAPGQWDLRVTIAHADGDYRVDRRIWVRP
ncbi:MAG: FixH family protein [Azospirillaceae bacterium]